MKLRPTLRFSIELLHGLGVPLYFRNDGHWLPAGHAIAAASIFKQLLPFLKRAEPESHAPVAAP